MYIHLHTFTYIQYINIHVHTLTYMYIHLHTCTYMYIHLHTVTYMYIHWHTCTYIYIHVHTWAAWFYTCLPLVPHTWVPWAAWVYTCLPLAPTLVFHSGCPGPHDFTLVSHLSPTLVFHTCLPLWVPWAACFKLVSHLSPTLGVLGRMILHLSPTCLPHVSPTLDVWERMSLHLSPTLVSHTCLPLWVLWAEFTLVSHLSPTLVSHTCLPHLSPTLVSHSGFLVSHVENNWKFLHLFGVNAGVILVFVLAKNSQIIFSQSVTLNLKASPVTRPLKWMIRPIMNPRCINFSHSYALTIHNVSPPVVF